MKKFLTLMCAIAMSTIAINATEVAKTPSQAATVQQKMAERRIQQNNAFERRLELTEVQIFKARQIRQSGHEKLMPVINQIKAKKQEAEMVRRSRMAVQMQEEKLTVIDNELRILEKQANDIRKSNMREFESILTRQQKRTLKQMKKEGRQKYHSEHPVNMQKMMQPHGFGPKPPVQAK